MYFYRLIMPKPNARYLEYLLKGIQQRHPNNTPPPDLLLHSALRALCQLRSRDPRQFRMTSQNSAVRSQRSSQIKDVALASAATRASSFYGLGATLTLIK